tara:strand:- start:625 stop:1503 length:879 start_codon:yes stop_codon:yes gene_type:complete
MGKKFKLFCFGFGQVAKYFVNNLLDKNSLSELITTNTKKTETKKINNFKYKSYFFSDNNFDIDLINDLQSSKKVLISIPPKNKNDLVLKNFGKYFKNKNFDWVTYLSATNVYGDKKGEWVNENTDPNPLSSKGKSRFVAENEWLNFYKKFLLKIQIFRLSGIYSKENNIINKLQTGDYKIVEKKNNFFSRIHVEDISEILTLSLNKFKPGEVYNISDNYPCSNEEVVTYASQLLKINKPSKIKVDDLQNETLKDFYRESKKVDNNKMKKFFNYDLKFSTYKEGLDNIIDHII